MNILALDTATAVLSIALAADRGLWSFQADAGPAHSETLMGALDALMKTAGLPPEKLEGVLCMRGPGSFTGLRIGFSAARGLAFSLGIPFASVPTLDCMAFPLSPWPGIVLPLLDAKKNRFFTALYRKGRRLSAYMDLETALIHEKILQALASAPPGERRVLLTGPDAEAAMREFGKLPLPPQAAPAPGEDFYSLDPEFRKGWARNLLMIAKNVDIFNNNEANIHSGPEYLRKSDAELLFYPDNLVGV
jgi:tRNA threonylcarbamoyladenosine biosynthesis protein TsaB